MQRTSSISDFEWWILLAGTAFVDLIQIILDLFFVGLIADSLIDLGYAFSLAFYLLLRNYPMEGRVLLLIFSTFIVEFIPMVDVAPFWTLDVWMLRKWDLERKRQNKLMEEQQRLAIEQNQIAKNQNEVAI